MSRSYVFLAPATHLVMYCVGEGVVERVRKERLGCQML